MGIFQSYQIYNYNVNQITDICMGEAGYDTAVKSFFLTNTGDEEIEVTLYFNDHEFIITHLDPKSTKSLSGLLVLQDGDSLKFKADKEGLKITVFVMKTKQDVFSPFGG